MTVRVYVPSTIGLLREVVAAGGIGPAPFTAHAVTDAVRRELADGGDEEWEYTASTAAAQSSVGLLHDDESARRVVLAVDVPQVQAAREDDPTVVEVDEVVPVRRISAVLADSAEAEQAVASARQAVSDGSPEAARLLERCLDHELGWWAVQELDQLLADVGDR